MSDKAPTALRAPLPSPQGEISYYPLDRIAAAAGVDPHRLPFSIRVLLEAVARHEDGELITREDVLALAAYDPARPPRLEIAFRPARVLLQDFTGVPCLVDLAAMRSAVRRLGGDPQRIDPQIPVDLVVDHSVQVDIFASERALDENARLEFERNRERYEFLHWGQRAFQNLRVVPPASGICHQVNLEYLATVVRRSPAGPTAGSGSDPAADRVLGLAEPAAGAAELAFPDTLVGTDSHTPMINGLGVLGWGVGGIEAEAVMLGQPLYMLAPAVVGVRLTGRLPEGATATDLVLTLTDLLRRQGVVGKFVEFYGPGLSSMTVPDRATIANMAPEYGATVGYFPVDHQTLAYLRSTGRPEELVDLVERYCRAQGLFRTDETPDPEFSDRLELDLSTVSGCLAGPKRPQDRVALVDVQAGFRRALSAPREERGFAVPAERLADRATVRFPGGSAAAIGHGAVVIAAITSCTNTSNPTVMLAAGLLARNAVAAGLTVKPWVKTSLAPGSKVVTDYLHEAGLTRYLEQLGFHTVGYGCTTCIGNSGPLPEHVARAVDDGNLIAAAVLSGNRNFEGRINSKTQANYLASPPLVVAYALAGTADIDLTREPLGLGATGQPVFLRDIWPSDEEIQRLVAATVNAGMFARRYEGIERSNEEWNRIPAGDEAIYRWRPESTYIQEPPYFDNLSMDPIPVAPIVGARVLVMAGDSVTTDHISPAGTIATESPAGEYLRAQGVDVIDFNTYGSRRGNDRVMTRGTFANIRFRNQLAPGTEGGWTRHHPSGEITSIFEAARRYRAAGIPTIVLAGRDYGMGSSRDWAAKGTALLGARAVIARSFERIHRSNLVGMGVLPLQFREGESASSLSLTGDEVFTIHLGDDVQPGQRVAVEARLPGGSPIRFDTVLRLDTPIDLRYYRHGGILPAVLRGFLGAPSAGTRAT